MLNLIPKEAEFIINKLHDCGYEAFLVGGCVRDMLMGTTPNDWDITTNALPQDVVNIFPTVIETGIKYGTVTVIINHLPFEVTTYRVDGDYNDNRRPKDVLYTNSLTKDLSRRDFTVNAMAFNRKDGLIDPFGGKEDIQNKILKCVGNPTNRFNEDSLRILRALRFASTKGFAIDPITNKAILKQYTLMDKLSTERILSEIQKLLTGDFVYSVLTEYAEVITFVLPDLKPMIGCKQNNPHHKYDVWAHTCNTVKNVPPKLTLRLAALFHDAGKPKTKTTENGVDHFYGHAKESEKIATNTLSRSSNDLVKSVANLVKHHDTDINDRKSIKRMVSKFGLEQIQDLLILKKADMLAQSGFRKEEKTRIIKEAEKILNDLKQENACFKLKDLKINGKDLIDIGYNQGKHLGKTLHKIFQLVLDDELPNNKKVLIEKARELKKTTM